MHLHLFKFCDDIKIKIQSLVLTSPYLMHDLILLFGGAQLLIDMFLFQMIIIYCSWYVAWSWDKNLECWFQIANGVKQI